MLRSIYAECARIYKAQARICLGHPVPCISSPVPVELPQSRPEKARAALLGQRRGEAGFIDWADARLMRA
jgi:hypothetical protein